MPDLILQFPRADYPSLQVGDVAYYCNTNLTGVHNTQSLNNVISLGPIVDIIQWDGFNSFIISNMAIGTPSPVQGSYIMFSKDNKANMSSILGYYAEIEFRNNSTTEAELFSVGTEVFESSK